MMVRVECGDGCGLDDDDDNDDDKRRDTGLVGDSNTPSILHHMTLSLWGLGNDNVNGRDKALA